LSRHLRGILSLDDFEPAAERHLPRPLFGYIAGAAENQRAYRNNALGFQDYALITRVLVDVSRRTQAIELFGRSYASPFGISPMGLSALTAYRGDIALALAAQQADVPMVLSGTSLIPMEDVIRAAPGTWFQAYVPGDARRIDALIDRVAAAGFETLVVTVDTNVAANRENNIRTGFSTPLRPSLRLAYDGLIRPRWLFGTFGRTLWRHGMPHFENSFAERGAPILSSTVLRDFSARDHLNWAHLERIRSRWQGHLVIKGVLSSADARRAREVGVDGIIVSNHGGRQLDGAVSPLMVLPDIVAAVGDLPVMLDGGIRRGTDVLIALALGARCVFVGRPFGYAAAIAGQAGVAHGIGLLRDEIDRNMAMLGIRQCNEMAPDMLVSCSRRA
jgi:L-lactate dehydrogenase (cytochrome)